MGIYFRESGEGPGVVCLHSNASTSGQWSALIDLLSPRFKVLAPDLLGAGRGAPWPDDRVVTLGDESAILEPVFARARDPFHIVGHSYGGAVALIAALTQPERIRSMILYEPTMFSLLKADPQGQPALKEIHKVASDAAAFIDAGDQYKAAELFIDYWVGPGAWAATPEKRQEPMAASMVNVGGWLGALANEPTPLDEFRNLAFPVLYLMGERSPASSRGVARLLQSVLPRVQMVELDGLGHMAPVTHPQAVNEIITSFLEGQPETS